MRGWRLLAFVALIFAFASPAYAAEKWNPFVKYYEVTATVPQPNEYTSYFMLESGVQKRNPGERYQILKGTEKTVEWGLSGSLRTPLNLVQNKIGYTIKNSSINLSGAVSAEATPARPYIAPYYRKSYRVWAVTEREYIKCLGHRAPNTFVTTYHTQTTSTYTRRLKVGFNDSQAYKFGYASAKANLPQIIEKSSNPLFTQQ